MRLSPAEQAGLLDAVALHLPSAAWALLLFGSRTDDSLRGGDIDLLLRVDDPALVDAARAEKTRILVAMKERLGDQRIDLLIEGARGIETNPFLSRIASKAIVLGGAPRN